MSDASVNLLGLPRRELEQFFTGIGEKPFRARQLMKWLYARGVTDPMQMTDIALTLRQELAARSAFALPAISMAAAERKKARFMFVLLSQISKSTTQEPCQLRSSAILMINAHSLCKYRRRFAVHVPE